MKQTRVVKLVAVLAVVGLVAAACGGSKKSSSSGGAKGNLAAAPGFDPTAKTIHVGVITPLTGPAAAIGIPLTAGTETWFKYINQEKYPWRVEGEERVKFLIAPDRVRHVKAG